MTTLATRSNSISSKVMRPLDMDTLALGNVEADGETPLGLNCTVGALAVSRRGGQRSGSGRKPLPLSMLRRPDLKDRRELKKARPAR